MKNKKWLRVVAFLLILVLSVGYVAARYDYPPNHDTRSLAAFAEFEKNTVDGVALGTSVVKYGFVPTAAYEQSGVAVGLLATSLQPFGATIPLLKYAKKTQNIKFAIIDVHGLRSAAVKNSVNPTKIQNLYLNIPGRIEGYKVMFGLFDYADRVYDYYGKPTDEKQTVDKSEAYWYAPLIAFHSRWKDGLVKKDFKKPHTTYLGAYDVKSRVFATTDCSPYYYCWDYEVSDIDDFQKNELKLLFEYLEENNIEPLFINMPSFRDKDEQQENASLIAYCQKQGYKAIDFCTREMLTELSIDPKTDFLNRGHLNSKGSVKFSKYIAKYLTENGFSAPDHRGQDSYKVWDEQAEKYNKFYEKGWKNAQK